MSLCIRPKHRGVQDDHVSMSLHVDTPAARRDATIAPTVQPVCSDCHASAQTMLTHGTGRLSIMETAPPRIAVRRSVAGESRRATMRATLIAVAAVSQPAYRPMADCTTSDANCRDTGVIATAIHASTAESANRMAEVGDHCRAALKDQRLVTSSEHTVLRTANLGYVSELAHMDDASRSE